VDLRFNVMEDIAVYTDEKYKEKFHTESKKSCGTNCCFKVIWFSSGDFHRFNSNAEEIVPDWKYTNSTLQRLTPESSDDDWKQHGQALKMYVKEAKKIQLREGGN